MKISFSPVKGWWKKRLSQKSHVDEKRSGRPSILRKVQKIVISKSLHKRGRSTRKLASKLTFWGLQSSKDTVHRYLRFDLWSLFMQEACFMQNLQKLHGKWVQFSQETGETEVNSEQTWGRLYLQVNVQCTCQCLKLAKITVSGPKTGQKWNQLRSPCFLQKSWFWAQWQLQVCPSYMCCLQNKLWELSISIRFHENMLDLTLLQDRAPAHKALETQDRLWNIFSQF